MPFQQVIDWDAIRDSIHDWFQEATGLVILWSDQDAPQPEYPYATLNIISGPTRIGGRDDVITSTDLTKAGEEVEICRQGPRLFTVSCQIHVGQVTDAFGTRQEPEPACNARALMDSAEGQLEIESTRASFHNAVLSFVRHTGQQSLDLVIDGEFLSRVQMDVTFATTARTVERTTYIEDVTITATIEPSEGQPPIVEDFSVDNPP